jgi:hypothetical protein
MPMAYPNIGRDRLGVDLKAAQSRQRIICLVIQDQEFDINVMSSSSERNRSTKFQSRVSAGL